MRWFQDHLEDGVTVRDVSDALAGFAITGPRARDVLAALTHEDVSHAAFPFMGCRVMDVGLIRARVARISVAGELGYEIACAPAEHIGLRRTLLEAGAAAGIREFGYQALLSLRLEKSFGIWSAEFTQEYTPRMTAMDRWIDWSKDGFIGREAALAEREGPPPRLIQVTLEVAADDADASGYEPVWSDGRRVGYVTSGGYGHTVSKSLAMALIEPALASPGTALTTHVVGALRQARVIAPSPYDPDGKAIRQ
jgi:dimethylglycine dehydrogenase